MYRIYYNQEDGMVEQIFNLSLEPKLKDELNENSFFGFLMIDSEESVDFGCRYNSKRERFERVFRQGSDPVEIEPSKSDALEEELFITQNTLDFLLMGGGEDSIADYLAMRINKGRLGYREVVSKFPNQRVAIDRCLNKKQMGRRG